MAANFQDQIGAETVHKPDHAVVEICLVHGLGGGRVSTWKKDEVFWPYNLLARDIPDARIITWGYDADVAHFVSPVSTNRVKDNAKSLSSALNGLRSSPETSTRPLILIAHSLGGIICAQALLQTSAIDLKDVEKFSTHTAALAFMSTPFEGSNAAKWTNIFDKLLRLFPVGNMNRNLLDHLKSNSHDLKSLGEEFPKWLVDRQSGAGRRVHVMCFFEELPTPPVGLIVSRESAQIAGFDYVSLPADHVGMCKFENCEDPKYKTVLYTLRKWVEEIKTLDERGQTKAIAPQVKTKMGDNYGGSQVGSDSSSHRSGDNISSTFVSSISKQPSSVLPTVKTVQQ